MIAGFAAVIVFIAASTLTVITTATTGATGAVIALFFFLFGHFDPSGGVGFRHSPL